MVALLTISQPAIKKAANFVSSETTKMWGEIRGGEFKFGPALSLSRYLEKTVIAGDIADIAPGEQHEIRFWTALEQNFFLLCWGVLAQRGQESDLSNDFNGPTVKCPNLFQMTVTVNR